VSLCANQKYQVKNPVCLEPVSRRKEVAKTLVVTGGSRGIGAAIAKLAARDGYDVVLTYRVETEQAASVVRDIESIGRRALAVQADVAVEADVLRLFEIVDREFGTLDALVNNAGVDHVCTVMDVDADSIDWAFSINVKGPILCTREAAKRMAKSRGGNGGVVVHVGSGSSRTGGAGGGQHVYAGTKAALDVYTMTSARELGPEGVRTAVVRPGATETDMFSPEDLAATRAFTKDNYPLGRMGQPEEIAEAVVWLCSDKASFITGFPLDVTGGR